jgi:hypothetical protein
VALPEIPDAETEPAVGCADVAESAGPLALSRDQPRVTLLGALADVEAVCAGLEERPVVVSRNILEALADRGWPGVERRRRLAGDLRVANGFSRIAAKAGAPAHGFAKEPLVLSGETHVPVVERGAAHVKPDADPRLKSFRSSPSKTIVCITPTRPA